MIESFTFQKKRKKRDSSYCGAAFVCGKLFAMLLENLHKISFNISYFAGKKGSVSLSSETFRLGNFC